MTATSGQRTAVCSLLCAALVAVPGLSSRAEAAKGVKQWIKQIPVDQRQLAVAFAMQHGAEGRVVQLEPRQGLRGARNAIHGQRLPQSTAGLLTLPIGPTTGPAWQKAFTSFRRKTDPNGRQVAKYDQQTIGQALGAEGVLYASLMGMEPKLAQLTVDQVMAGEQVQMAGNDKRGALNHAQRTGGTLWFNAGHDSIQTSSTRYLRGKLVEQSYTASAVPFGKLSGDVRDNWILVADSKVKGGKDTGLGHMILCPIRVDGTGTRLQVPVKLSAAEYGKLMGNRLDLGAFVAAADQIGVKERLGATVAQLTAGAAN